jgi:hypothetical protein
MNNDLNNLIHDINTIKFSNHPVLDSWEIACNNIGLKSNDSWREFGRIFSRHPDLNRQNIINDYHNYLHSGEAILSSSILVKNEFTKIENKNIGPILLFSMMCHDIAHNGTHNTSDYELEIKAVNSMNQFVNDNPQILEFWNNNLAKEYGTWSNFSKTVEKIILGTDFKIGPKENSKQYIQNPNLKINQLQMLANESDILPSCLSSLGPERGIKLAKEQKNPNVGTWKARQFFLQNLVIYCSNASQHLGIQAHIEKQLTAFSKYTPEYLDDLSNKTDFLSVAKKIDYEVNNNFKEFNSKNIQKIRDKFFKPKIKPELKIY